MAAKNRVRQFLSPALCGAVALLFPTWAWAGPASLKDTLQRAEQHEKSYEWDKAFAAYDDVLKSHRDVPGVKERQTAVLRRFWQEQRHNDLSYRKEVLSLDYSQALRLNHVVFETLLDTSLPKTKLSPGQVLRKGIEELETALCDPTFLRNYLAEVRPAALQAFRGFLQKKKNESTTLTRGQCLKVLREVALAGQSSLDLKPTVAIMELACGACYAIDEYTAYLTPSQFRDLAESLKAGPMVFTPSVQFQPKSMETGYLAINVFQETTPQEVDDAFDSLSKGGMKSLILDLRGNPGGLVESAIEVARRFLVSGVIASTENYDPKLSTTYHSRNPAAWTVPLVILVDGDTASAAEVLAGALKDNGRARIIGQPTFGKGSAQGLVKLPEAIGGLPTGGLRLTIARFFSPKGLPYSGQGVMPDLILPRFKPDGMDNTDQHLTEAIADFQRQIAMMR